VAAATYRIGPSDVFSPGDLQADANTLDTQVEILDAQIEGNTAVPADYVDQWVAFQGQWKAFYANEFSGYFSALLASFNDANREQLIAYEKQFAAFASKSGSFGAQVIAPVEPSTGAKDTLGDLLKNQGLPSLPSTTSVVVVIVAIIIALVVWKS
jgi:hypothetical protein